MRYSWKWLSELAELDGIDPAEAARLVTLRTAEVESIETVGGALDGVVAALVERLEPHPGADRLRLATVAYGGEASVRVVCGAPNVAEGQVVCFARVGTTLPNGLTLKKAKIRGVESEGMICAEDEMGLGSAHDGIVVLPAGTAIGTPVSRVLGLSDAVFEVSNTAITNRPDLWGHAGYAREVAAVTGRALRLPGAPRAEAAVAAAKGAPVPVSIVDEAGCRRYVAIAIEGVSNGPSPAGAVRRLEAAGLRSVDLLVDLTNLVMLEQGQPLHAFDLREVRGQKVVVRRAAAGERMATLDGVDRVLVPDDLVIADGERALAIAGVMGGTASGVRADTTAILLESASFDAGRVRKTSTRLGLRTDASSRFEKSLDPVGAWTAAMRFVELLLEAVPAARIVAKPTDVYPRPYPPLAIDLPFELVRKRLGAPVSDAEIVTRLASVGFSGAAIPGGARVRVPTWRATKDVAVPEDLVEEVGRLHGYEHVKVAPPPGSLRAIRPAPDRALERDGKAILCLDLGYAEIASYAFHGAKDAERLGTDPEGLVRLANPLSADQDRLQATCAQNLLRAAVRNQPHAPSVRLCEWTHVFVKGAKAATGGPLEIPVAGLLATRAEAPGDRKGPPSGDLFLSVKEDVLALLSRLGVEGLCVEDAGAAALDEHMAAPPWLHPGRRAAVRDRAGAIVALAGEVLPAVRRAFGLDGQAAIAEVRLDRALAARSDASTYRPVPRFPEAPFDVAVIVPRKTPSADVAAILEGCAGPAVRSVSLFDAYEGAGIPEGHRSLAFTVVFGDDDATLLPKAIERLQARALDALRKAGFTVRTASPS